MCVTKNKSTLLCANSSTLLSLWFERCLCVCVSQGAFWGLMVGLVVGLTRMVLEFSYETPSCGQPDGRPAVLADVHYLYFALILLALTFLIIAAVSLATAPVPKEHVRISFVCSFLSVSWTENGGNLLTHHRSNCTVALRAQINPKVNILKCEICVIFYISVGDSRWKQR